jgi:hypothetical protein
MLYSRRQVITEKILVIVEPELKRKASISALINEIGLYNDGDRESWHGLLVLGANIDLPWPEGNEHEKDMKKKPSDR